MWYHYDEEKMEATPRIKEYQVAFYDMLDRYEKGRCFDESWWTPEELSKCISFVETVEDKHNDDRTRVFLTFDNGDRYEIKFKKINGVCSNFYDENDEEK